MKNLILFVITLSFVFTPDILSDDKEKSHLFDVQKELGTIVVSILKENSFQNHRENISPEAYLIINNNYKSIFEFMDDLPENFSEGEETIVGYIHIWLTEDNNAYMIMQTTTIDVKVSWHSIFFKLNEKDKWQIFNWHKS